MNTQVYMLQNMRLLNQIRTGKMAKFYVALEGDFSWTVDACRDEQGDNRSDISVDALSQDMLTRVSFDNVALRNKFLC